MPPAARAIAPYAHVVDPYVCVAPFFHLLPCIIARTAASIPECRATPSDLPIF
jgi:hypothetical protein